MRRDVKELVEWAQSLGWKMVDGDNRRAHHMLEHPNGTRVTFPKTPSDWRSLENTRAQIRRASGVRSQSGPAARYRHKPNRNGFDMEAAVAEARLRAAQREVEARARRERHAAYQAEHDALVAQLEKLDPRRSPNLARLLARRIQFMKFCLKRTRP